MNKPHRNTINVEIAKIISHDAYPGEQFILRVHAPQIASIAKPGQFAHIKCDQGLPMRRPISIMMVNQKSGLVDFLYKVFGEGTRLLSKQGVGICFQCAGFVFGYIVKNF